jgi:carboxyl-terminal processing protease
VLLGTQVHTARSPDDAVEQFKKMKRAFLLISGKYVEQVSPKRLAEGGVTGMLDRLDPHSSYVPPEEVARQQDRIRGSFGGVGIRYDILNDTARVVAPIEGGPSEEAGIMAGDRIVEIEDSTAIGLSNQGIRNRLTGRKGTDVTFTVHRPLSNERLTFTITRGEVPLYSIHASYMIDDRTGYLEIGRFAKSTPDEFLRAVDDLKSQGMERLVIDLRDNPGGVLESAVRVADELLATPGLPIVTMKGRATGADQTWRTQRRAILAEAPVTLLVNGNTASASEILAGALQDHDRALLVGRRTFGKGLVQKPFSLNDGSLLNLTIGAYYTPVGRFIQTPYEDGNRKGYYQEKLADRRASVYHVREYRESIPDSLTYHTKHGRTVFGGGGILPDYVVQPDTASLSGFLRRGDLDRFFAFYAGEWLSGNAQTLRSTWQGRPDAFLSSYQVPEAALSGFWTYAQEKDVLTLTTDPAAAAPAQQVYLKSTTEGAREIVRTHIKGQLANVLFGAGTGQPALNRVDPTVQEALSLWPSSSDLAAYHSSSSRGRE